MNYKQQMSSDNQPTFIDLSVNSNGQTVEEASNEPIMSSGAINPTAISSNNPNELIADGVWEEWLYHLVITLGKYDKVFNNMEFLGQIKCKIEDCSRSYTGMWVLDMLYETVQKNQTSLTNLNLYEQFVDDLKELQAKWNDLMNPIRETRRRLLGKKCLEFFYKHYRGASQVYERSAIKDLGSNNGDRWFQVSKKAHELGLTSNEEYKEFLAKLMIEMVKY